MHSHPISHQSHTMFKCRLTRLDFECDFSLRRKASKHAFCHALTFWIDFLLQTRAAAAHRVEGKSWHHTATIQFTILQFASTK